MTAKELRQKYLDFFKEKGHAIIPSAPLVPENDPTVLFTTAGMHPLVPFLLGQTHPQGKRLANCQRCVRTDDIDEVGDDVHLTFFEMLGNWSLGDYWKEDAIKWSFEFLTKELKLPIAKLAVTCFVGDSDAPKDLESAGIWEKLGIPKERIYFLPKKDNWWGPAGKTGPCGPDTEMFYWTGKGNPPDLVTGDNKEGWVEIWNDVFMQYVKDENGNFKPTSQKNVDTGMGLERTLAVLNGKDNVFQTDLFESFIKLLPTGLQEKKKRIIADHSRAIVFLISDGVLPSSKERGYILRRLIRRIVAYEYLDKADFLKKIFEKICKTYKGLNKENILNIFLEEKNKFLETLQKGITEYSKIENVTAQNAFYLYQSFGLPFDILKELNPQKTSNLKKEDFEEKLKKHQELSRTASAGMFKGGLADASEKVTKYHTATHLLLAGLRKVLNQEVSQKGSNITAERLRFDFSYNAKMTGEQIKDVENFVNDIIKKDLLVWFEEMSLEKAKELNAMGVFESKYGERVKVYTIGPSTGSGHAISMEICGGPHVERTGVLGKFKITKEEAVSSGVRRIKAVLE